MTDNALDVSIGDNKVRQLFEKLALVTTELANKAGKIDLQEFLTLIESQAREILAADNCRVCLLKYKELLNANTSYIKDKNSSKPQLSVLLLHEGKPIGSLNIWREQPNNVDDSDRLVLEVLGAQTVMAIQLAHAQEALQETAEARREVERRARMYTALALAGVASSAWRHQLASEAAELSNRVVLTREYLNQSQINDAGVKRQLDEIENLAKSMSQRSEVPSLSSEEGALVFDINGLITERLLQLQENERDSGVRLEARVQTAIPLTVCANPEWLRRALDILVKNAVRAVRSLKPLDPSRCLVTVTTSLQGQMVEVLVTDHGIGISADVREKLFKEKIEFSNGSGVGLLIAQAIIETYGGEIKVNKTDLQGTEMLIQLPYYKSVKG